MLRIGLTGGIGSGKSVVADEFRRLGVPIIDTDEIARELVEPGSDSFKEVVAAFGRGILGDDGRLNRVILRDRVFSDIEERKRLESILHPRVRSEVKKRVACVSAPYCLIVIPLLVEAGFRDVVDRVLAVDAPESARIERLMRDRGLTRGEVRLVMAAQATRAERLAVADDMLVNNGTCAMLREQVRSLHDKYIALTQGTRESAPPDA